jgi:hypothetical protein
MERPEDLAQLGRIVDRQDAGPLDPGQDLRHPGKLAPAEQGFALVILAAHKGWIEVEERAQAVKARDQIKGRTIITSSIFLPS